MNTYDIFITIVKHGSFSAAAKSLHRTPSTISKQMALLEQRLNLQLFDRTTRTLAMTEAGELYYKHCVDIAQRISNAEFELKEFSGEPGGTIRLTWPAAVSTSSVMETLSKFTQNHPGIKIEISVTHDSVNLIKENIDFAFRMSPSEDSSMIAIKLFDMELVICASHDLVKSYNMSNEKILASLPLLIPNNTQFIKGIRKFIPELMAIDIENHHRVNDISTIYNMAKRGMGVAILFRHIVEKELADGSFKDLTPGCNIPKQPVYLMFNRLSYTSKKLQLFKDFFKQRYCQNVLS